MSTPLYPDNQPTNPPDPNGAARPRSRPNRAKGDLGLVRDHYDRTSSSTSRPKPERSGETPVFSKILLFGFLGLFVSAAFYAGILFGRGNENQKATTKAPIASRAKPLPADAMDQLNISITELRNGDPSKAVEDLQKLAASYPDAPCLVYATAIAALTSQNLELAETMAKLCVDSGYRKSDALALLANIEIAKSSQSELPSFTDPALRAKDLLTQAIEADPLNAGPHIEMAAVSRRLGDFEQAIAYLERGKNLVFPVDTLVVTQTTLAILKDESQATTPEEHLPPFALAVRSARQGDTLTAALIFTDCRRHLPEETYAFLITDPAVRKFSDQPELKDILAGR